MSESVKDGLDGRNKSIAQPPSICQVGSSRWSDNCAEEKEERKEEKEEEKEEK